MELYLYDRLRVEAATLLNATGLVPQGMVTLVSPKGNIPADLAFPVFAVANAGGGKTNPAALAAEIAAKIVLPASGLFGAVTPAGGFVNFAVRPEMLAREMLAEVTGRGADFGKDAHVGRGEKTIVEFSSPNIAKKMHVGHLRSTVIGNAIRNILVALGYEVIADNHLGDWGTQFGYLLASLDHDGFPADMETDPINALVRIYSDFYKRSESDPHLKDLARLWFRKLEEGDPWARSTWESIIAISMAEFDRMYRRLGVTFDTQHGESFYEPMLEDVLDESLSKGVATYTDGGPVVVEFGEGGLPSCLLRKTDGATLYQTRDLATALYRWREYAPVRNIYVVGAEQNLHFQQVFEIVRRMGYEEIADRSVHIPFGAVTKATGEKFSARKGENIFLDEVLDEAITRAKAGIAEQIAAGKTELTEAEIETVGEMLGVGTVIYSDLYQGPERTVQFDWDKMLSPDGNTALYIQYTHARCRSIIRKGAEEGGSGADYDAALLVAPEEQVVLKHLAQFPHAVREAGAKFLPATVAEWTYTLAREFARFYGACPVLKAETPALRQSRLALTGAVATGLKNGMALLGISVPDRM